MNTSKKPACLPELTQKILNDPLMPVDNLLSKLWKELGLKGLFNKIGVTKRSGTDVPTIIYLLLIWTLLRAKSICFFSKEALEQFSNNHKDVLYDFIKREDINWRKSQTDVTKKVYQQIKNSKIKAFVADDTVKIRRGKKTEGVSLHFDHLTGRTVKGQQVLTLGMATEKGFIPLEQEIFIGQKKRQLATFKDNRHHAAKRYQQSLELTKPALLSLSLKRAISNGFEADYFLADAWFGNKPTLRLTDECSVTAILRMKKDKTKYKITTIEKSNKKEKMLTLKEIYQQFIRKQWVKKKLTNGTQYQILNVELNLAETEKSPENWIKVRLLFIKKYNENKENQKQDWAVFLTTDPQLEAQRILEIYALRWGIEVYFKEVKQNLGFLKEQTISYASHLASLSLTAIRYLLLLYSALEQQQMFCSVRNKTMDGLQHLSFANKLWGFFQHLIMASITPLVKNSEEITTTMRETIDSFFIQAFQLE